MRTTIASYTSQGVSFLANETRPRRWSPSSDSIYDVIGLNTLQHETIPQVPTADLATTLSSLRSLAPSIGLPGCLPSCTYTPQDMWSLYDMPASDEGQGQTMAILGEGATSGVMTDLRDFERANSLPEVPVTVKDVGAGPFTDTSGSVEWDLDTQASTGVAPQVSGETLYFASSLSDVDAGTVVSSWVSDPDGPAQANASWGECETDPLNPVFNLPPFEQQTNPSPVVGLGDDLELVAENTLEQAATEGRTLFTSAGDTGSWSDGGNEGAANPPGTVCRGAPDVAAMSGDVATNGYDIISGGSPSVEGGTSLSSPLWVGTWTRVQAAAASELGFADPTIYAIGTGGHRTSRT